MVVLVVIAHYCRLSLSYCAYCYIVAHIYIVSHGSIAQKPYSCHTALKIFCDMNVFTFHILPMWLPITHIA